MNDLELTQLFLDYAESKKKTEELRQRIVAAVLEKGESVKIAGETATYRKPGFETPDYKAAAMAYMPIDFDLSQYSTVMTSTRWKDVCAALGVDASVGAPKPASVTVS